MQDYVSTVFAISNIDLIFVNCDVYDVSYPIQGLVPQGPFIYNIGDGNIAFPLNIMTFGIFTPYCSAGIADVKMEDTPLVYTSLSGPFNSFNTGTHSLHIQASFDSEGGVYNLAYIAKDSLFNEFAVVHF